jgi:hypothetical protein
MFPRARKAPLSPNEESALRRAARGADPASDRADGDVRRLTAFGLVEVVGGRLVLTAAGRKRVKRLPPTVDANSHDHAAYGEPGKALAQFYDRSRRPH